MMMSANNSSTMAVDVVWSIDVFIATTTGMAERSARDNPRSLETKTKRLRNERMNRIERKECESNVNDNNDDNNAFDLTVSNHGTTVIAKRSRKPEVVLKTQVAARILHALCFKRIPTMYPTLPSKM